MNFCPSKLFHCLQVTEFPQYFLGSTIQLINKCSVSPMEGLCSHASVIVLNLYKLVSKQLKPLQKQMGEHGPFTVWHWLKEKKCHHAESLQPFFSVLSRLVQPRVMPFNNNWYFKGQSHLLSSSKGLFMCYCSVHVKFKSLKVVIWATGDCIQRAQVEMVGKQIWWSLLQWINFTVVPKLFFSAGRNGLVVFPVRNWKISFTLPTLLVESLTV